MKLFKKIVSVVAVLSLVAAVPMTASAATDVIDFEDGKVPAAIQMALMDDGTPDGDPSILSVVDFNGSKMLKVDSQENGIPKVKFYVVDLVGEEKFKDVVTIEYDMIIEKPDDVMTTWNGGTVGATPTGPSGWANGTEWSLQDDTKNVSDVTHLSHTLTGPFKFKEADKAFFMYMNWANNGTDIYFDNIRFLDEAGNPVPFIGLDAAPAKAATTAPKTGTTDYAVPFALAAVVMLAGAVVLKKRRSVEA
jgi:LPXTG-motif cell wall-anchored protein